VEYENSLDRYLKLEGSYNVRDLGGYQTSDGRITKWRTFFRSGSMHNLTEESQSSIFKFGIRTVIDLRTSAEKTALPNVFTDSSKLFFKEHNIIGDVPFEGYSNISAVDILEGGGEFAEGIFQMYCTFLDKCQNQIRDTLVTLSNSGSLPAIYHCAGGKDRTGIISAMLLGNVGVSYDTIAKDYSLSAKYLMERYFEGVVQSPRPGETPDNYTWREYEEEFCPPESMLMTLSYLDDKYGGIKEYMKSIGVDEVRINHLRDSLIE
jgi:protein-tyrosine phosphatase